MGELLQFERGCRGCENLSQIGKGTFVCLKRVHMDDSDVIPIRDGKKTDDWNVCEGQNYVRTMNKHLHAD